MEQLAKALAAAKSHAAKYDEISSESVWERESINAIVANLEDAIQSLEAGGGSTQTPPDLSALKMPFPRDLVAQEWVKHMLRNVSPIPLPVDTVINDFDRAINDNRIMRMMQMAYRTADMQADAAGGQCPCPSCPNKPDSHEPDDSGSTPTGS